MKIVNCVLGVWIGPEGGWTAKEVELAQRSNLKIINLGQFTGPFRTRYPRCEKRRDARYKGNKEDN